LVLKQYQVFITARRPKKRDMLCGTAAMLHTLDALHTPHTPHAPHTPHPQAHALLKTDKE